MKKLEAITAQMARLEPQMARLEAILEALLAAAAEAGTQRPAQE